MNDLVYASRTAYGGGKPAENGLIRDRALKIYVPDEGGAGGRVHWSDGAHSFGWGEIVVVPPNVAHKFTDTDGGITVLIEQPLLPLKQVDVKIDVINDGIWRAAEQAVAFYGGDCAGKEAVLAALGGLIVGYILTFNQAEKPSPAVIALREDIDRNAHDCAYSVDISIRKLPLNYDYVRKLFKKQTGVTPHEYLTHTRMKKAKDILLSGVTNRFSDYTVTQIAEACGFPEPLYFSRVFKKYYGVAPSYYLKNLSETDDG